MKKRMIPIIILLIIVLVAVLLLVFFWAKGYLLIQTFGKDYIYLDERYHESDLDPYISAMEIAPKIEFDSVAEMRNRILFGVFSEEELKEIGRFYMKDGLIPIFNIAKLYEPLYPDDFNGYTVSWEGSYYTFTFHSPDNTRYQYFQISPGSGSYYPKHIEILMDYENRYTESLNRNCTLEAVVSETDRNATTYYFKRQNGVEFKEVIYQFRDHGTTFTVNETYKLDKSDSVPQTVEVYGEYQGVYFTFTMRDPEERPTVEWLSQFGIKKFRRLILLP